VEIEWRKFIHSDPEVLLGKPVVKGTRLSVKFILGLFAKGWTERIRQIGEKALRKLRHPSRTKKLRPFVPLIEKGIIKTLTPGEEKLIKIIFGIF